MIGSFPTPIRFISIGNVAELNDHKLTLITRIIIIIIIIIGILLGFDWNWTAIWSLERRSSRFVSVDGAGIAEAVHDVVSRLIAPSLD